VYEHWLFWLEQLASDDCMPLLHLWSEQAINEDVDDLPGSKKFS